jgi:hypothetical protein
VTDKSSGEDREDVRLMPHLSTTTSTAPATTAPLAELLDRLNRATNKVAHWRYQKYVPNSLYTLQEEKRAARSAIEEAFGKLREDAENWRYCRAHDAEGGRRSEY